MAEFFANYGWIFMVVLAVIAIVALSLVLYTNRIVKDDKKKEAPAVEVKVEEKVEKPEAKPAAKKVAKPAAKKVAKPAAKKVTKKAK